MLIHLFRLLSLTGYFLKSNWHLGDELLKMCQSLLFSDSFLRVYVFLYEAGMLFQYSFNYYWKLSEFSYCWPRSVFCMLQTYRNLGVSFVLSFRKIYLFYSVEVYYGGSSSVLWPIIALRLTQSPWKGQQRSHGVSKNIVWQPGLLGEFSWVLYFGEFQNVIKSNECFLGIHVDLVFCYGRRYAA